MLQARGWPADSKSTAGQAWIQAKEKRAFQASKHNKQGGRLLVGCLDIAAIMLGLTQQPLLTATFDLFESELFGDSTAPRTVTNRREEAGIC